MVRTADKGQALIELVLVITLLSTILFFYFRSTEIAREAFQKYVFAQPWDFK